MLQVSGESPVWFACANEEECDESVKADDGERGAGFSVGGAGVVSESEALDYATDRRP